MCSSDLATYTPDGRYVLVALETSREISILNAATGTEVRRLDVQRTPQGIAVSPDGKHIINIHPAYLPEFPGAHGIKDAWQAGVSESGVTIHWVDSGVDTGKIIQQVRVPRLADDTIDSFEERIHETEYKLYPQVLESLGVGRK